MGATRICHGNDGHHDMYDSSHIFSEYWPTTRWYYPAHPGSLWTVSCNHRLDLMPFLGRYITSLGEYSIAIMMILLLSWSVECRTNRRAYFNQTLLAEMKKSVLNCDRNDPVVSHFAVWQADMYKITYTSLSFQNQKPTDNSTKKPDWKPTKTELSLSIFF